MDPELGQLLKVVAFSPEDHKTKTMWEDFRAANITDEARAEFGTITTLFTEERNGLRFPGKVTLEQVRYRGRTTILETVELGPAGTAELEVRVE